MNLKMKTLAVAMIAAGTLGTAQASQALFPYIVNSDTVTTIVSVINTGTGYPDSAGGETLHYALWYKTGSAKATDKCDEVNQFLPTSTNDLQTFDMGAAFGKATKGVLFNDPSINNDWVKTGKRFDLANLAPKPLRGYLVVDEPGTSVDEPKQLEGEAMVFEFKSGATWGYTAGRAGDGDFTKDSDITFTTQNVSIKPWGEFTTMFYVTPIDGEMFGGNNQAKTTLSLNMNGTVMFDRDENPVSGSVSKDVVCVWGVNADELLSSGAKTLLPDGGWGQLNAETNPENEVSKASVIKLDFNKGGKLNGETVTGTFNNAFQLR